MTGHYGSSRGTRAPSTVVLVSALLLCAGSLWRLVGVSRDQLRAPFDLCFESPNLCTIQDIRCGRNIYSPERYAGVPFHMTIYTPLYHHLVAALPQSRANPFLAGRLVSSLFMLAAACAVVAMARRSSDLGVLLWAFSLFILVRPVVANTAYLKNDTAALACSVWAVFCADRFRNRAGVVCAAVLCVLAVAAKQSCLAAAGACMAWYALRRLSSARPLSAGRASPIGRVPQPFRTRCRPRCTQARLFVAVAAGLGIASLAVSLVFWGPGFVHSVCVAPRSPMSWQHFVDTWSAVLRQPLLWILILLAASTAVSSLAKSGLQELRSSPYLWYLLSSWAVLLMTVGKEGSSNNYFIEPSLASALWLGWVGQATWRAVGRRWAIAAILVGIVGPFALAELTYKNAHRDVTFLLPDGESEERFAGFRELLEGEIARAGLGEPLVLNLARAQLSFLFGERTCVSDPFLYPSLWEAGSVPVDPLLQAVARRRFDLVMLPRDRFPAQIRRYRELRRVVAAVESAYSPFPVSPHLGVRFFVRPGSERGSGVGSGDSVGPADGP